MSLPSELVASLSNEFEILERLGVGGMGEVHALRSKESGQHFAMKRVLVPSPARRDAFLEELLTWADLPEHPHLTAFRFFRMTSDELLVFAELVPHGTLEEAASDLELSTTDRLRLAREIARGLGAAHHHGVVHCDVKPRNVLLTDALAAKVTDFGIARVLDATAAGFTPAFAAPEQVNGDAVTAATDVYAWALTVLFLFHGQVEWASGLVALEVLERHLREGSTLQGVEMPEALAPVLRRALAPAPADRWASMTEAERALDDVLPEDATAGPVESRVVAMVGDESIATWVPPERWLGAVARRARTVRGAAFEDFLLLTRARDSVTVERSEPARPPPVRDVPLGASAGAEEPAETQFAEGPAETQFAEDDPRADEPAETAFAEEGTPRATRFEEDGAERPSAPAPGDRMSKANLRALLGCELVRVLLFLGDRGGAGQMLAEVAQEHDTHGATGGMAVVLRTRVALLEASLAIGGDRASALAACETADRFLRKGGSDRDRVWLEIYRARLRFGSSDFQGTQHLENAVRVLHRTPGIPRRDAVLALALLEGVAAYHRLDLPDEARGWAYEADRVLEPHEDDPALAALRARCEVALARTALEEGRPGDLQERRARMESRLAEVGSAPPDLLADLAALFERAALLGRESGATADGLSNALRLVELEDRLVLQEACRERGDQRVRSRVLASSVALANGDAELSLRLAEEAKALLLEVMPALDESSTQELSLAFQVHFALAEASRRTQGAAPARRAIDDALRVLDLLLAKEGADDLRALRDELVLARWR